MEMLTVQELTKKYGRQLPKTRRFNTHAYNLAWIVTRGKVEMVDGYLRAMEADWTATSKNFNTDLFDSFRFEVLKDAKAALLAETQALLNSANFVRPQIG